VIRSLLGISLIFPEEFLSLEVAKSTLLSRRGATEARMGSSFSIEDPVSELSSARGRKSERRDVGGNT